MLFQPLPNHGRIFFKNAAGTVLTSTLGRWGPLTSTYQGIEVSAADVVNTAIFICANFTQRRLATKLVEQGDYIWIDATENYLITGLKDWGSHTEFTGLRQATPVTASVASGIISEWAFRSSALLGDDEQGKNLLTKTGGVAFSSDRPSEISTALGSADFDGVDDMLEIADASQQLLDVTGSITIAFRLKIDTLPGITSGIFCKADNSTNRGYYVFLDTTNHIRCELSNDGSASPTAIGATALSSGTWYSVCCVYNGTDIRIYINGALDSNGVNNPKAHTTGIFNNNQKLVMGARSDGAQYLDCKIAHVFIFSAAKTSTQVATWHSTDAWT